MRSDRWYWTTVYRMYDADDTLLYVGCSIEWPQRLRSHRAVKARAWWFDIARVEMQHFDTRTEAGLAEQAAIVAEKPLYNGAVHRPLTDSDLAHRHRLQERDRAERAA